MYQIDEENSDILFEVSDKTVILKLKSGAGSGGSSPDIYLIKLGDPTTPSDKNVFSALRAQSTFLRKDQVDSTSFLLKLLAGLETGEYSVGESGARIDAKGDAEVRNLVARIKATVAELEAKTVTVSDKVTTLNLLIQKLAETYDLSVSNVATLFRTIVKDYVSSETFVPGITGEGMKLYKALNGDWNLEVDNVTVRKAMTIFELIISKIRSVNGGLVVSLANGRIKSVAETTGSPTYYALSIEGDMTFVADDLVRCQVFSSTGAKYYWVPIDSVSDETILILKSEFPDGVVPAIGDDLVQMGNKTNTARQGVLYLTASEDGKPRFSVLDGVNSTDLTEKNKVILGCLDGITDSDFPSDAQPSGYGLWAANVFLKGLFILRNGKSIEDELNDQITAVQTAFEIREGQISSKVTQATTAAQTATNKAGEAATSAGTASTKAADATKAASNAANILQTVTKKETNINQTADAIELKATRAETAAGKAESAEASINVKANGIVLQASNKAAQTAVDGLKIGGRNLIIRSGELKNTLVGTTGKLQGSSNSDTMVNNISVTPGEVLAFSKRDVTTDSYWRWKWLDNEGNYISRTATNSNFLLWTVPGNAYFIQVSYPDAAYPKIERGNKATDWTPAPEDVTADYTAKLQVLNDSINAKVSQTTYNGLVSRVSTAEAKITPKEINLTVSSQIQTAVDGVQVGGVNLLPKSKDFSGASVCYDLTSQTYNGLPIMSHVNTSGGFQDVLAWNTLLKPDGGAYYTLSFYAKGSGRLYSYFYPNAIESGYSSEGITTTSPDGSAQTTLSADWKRYWIVWKTLPTQTEAKNLIVARLFDNTTIYLCGVKFENGNKATPWTAAPADLESRVSAAEFKITPEQINITVSSQINQAIIDASKTTTSLVDATALDQNKYYPITIYLPDPSKTCRVIVKRSLDSSYGIPSYSTHPRGFSIDCEWRTNASGWGTFPVNRVIEKSIISLANGNVIGTIGQLDESSQEYVYVRGGSKYYVEIEGANNASIILRTENYTWQSGAYSNTINILDSVTAPVVTYKTESEIRAGLSIVSGGINFFGQNFSFAGKITVGSLDNNLQNSINNKANSNQVATDLLAQANAMAQKIGYADYNTMAAYYTAGQSIIDGATIRTSLINADAIITSSLLASKIRTTDITTGKLTVTTGAKIGGFAINGSMLTGSSDGVNLRLAPEYIYFKDSYHNNTVMIGGDTIPGIGGGAFSCPASFSSQRIITNTSEGIGNIALMLSATGAAHWDNYVESGNTALHISNGHITGFRLNCRIINTSQTLSKMDNMIISERDSGDITLTLPSDAERGQMLFIRKDGGSRIWIKGSYIVNDGDWYRERSTSVQLNRGGLGILMFNGTYWTWNNMNG